MDTLEPVTPRTHWWKILILVTLGLTLVASSISLVIAFSFIGKILPYLPTNPTNPEPVDPVVPEFTGDSATFAIIGDWGSGTANQVKIAQALSNVCNTTNCSFVVSTGDNFYPDGASSETDDNFQTLFEKMYNIQKRWYLVLGNHDYHQNPSAEVKYTNYSSRWYLPSRYYAEDLAVTTNNGRKLLIAFTFIDTSPMIKAYTFSDVKQQNSTEQLLWLRNRLSNLNNIQNTTIWNIVVGHHPIYSISSHGDNADLKTSLKPILDEYKVHLYLCGHDHNLQHISTTDSQVQHIISGSGGKSDTYHVELNSYTQQSKFFSSDYGFVVANANRKRLKLDFYDSQKNIIYSYTLQQP